MRMTAALVAVLAALLGVLRESAAATIDFDSLPPGEIVTDDYDSLGVIFGTDVTDTVANRILYWGTPAHSPPKVLEDGGEGNEGVISFSFDPYPANQVSFYGISIERGVTAAFYDVHDALLHSIHRTGSDVYDQVYFSYVDYGNISKVVFTTDLPDGITIDDLSFTGGLGDPNVPEPGTAVLLLAGAVGLPACAWRRRRCR